MSLSSVSSQAARQMQEQGAAYAFARMFVRRANA